jgi:competence protein ComGC
MAKTKYKVKDKFVGETVSMFGRVRGTHKLDANTPQDVLKHLQSTGVVEVEQPKTKVKE